MFILPRGSLTQRGPAVKGSWPDGTALTDGRRDHAPPGEGSGLRDQAPPGEGSELSGAAWARRTAAAALTLSEATRPRTGIATSASQAAATRGRSPRPSEPSTSTTPPE